jgi:hypothetical protein
VRGTKEGVRQTKWITESHRLTSSSATCLADFRPEILAVLPSLQLPLRNGFSAASLASKSEKVTCVGVHERNPESFASFCIEIIGLVRRVLVMTRTTTARTMIGTTVGITTTKIV